MTVQPLFGFTTSAEPVPVSAVQHYLSALWRRLSREQPAGVPLAPARMLNLVLYGEDEALPETAERLAGTVAARHPGRLIAVRLDRGRAGTEIAAEVSVRCVPDPTGQRQVCSELILLTVPAALRRYVPHALCALLLSDLPVALWWTGAPRVDDPLYRRLTADLVSRVLLDSRADDQPGVTLSALARWCAERSQATLGDLAWARLDPWRRAITAFFDQPGLSPPPARIRRVELMSGDAALPADALLLLGWLASRLAWQVEGVRQEPDAVQIDFLCGGRRVQAYATRVADVQPSPGLAAVHLHVALGAEAFYFFEAHRGHDANVVHTHVTPPGGPRSARSPGLPEAADEALVARLLDASLPDPLYVAALDRAAEIAGALG
jgi:glucose-6-phosphate dehydrogenase assembly protein OpcA